MKKNINTILIIFCLISIIGFNIYSAGQRKEYTEKIVKSNDSLITVINKYRQSIK